MLKVTLVCALAFSLLMGNSFCEEYVTVEKKGVMHTFSLIDETENKELNNFVKEYFLSWENKTFEVFDQVKDDQGIAIDLGAWIGTTAIWLSKHFYHVVAVEGDKVSVKYLRRNLYASRCRNVSICDSPITKNIREVVFGGRDGRLNVSISCVKDKQDTPTDFTVQSISFNQLIEDYVYSDRNINSHKVSFIKCDIEGGEEEILEDILTYAYQNNCKVHLSFHYDWWKSRKIEEFKELFSYFATDCSARDLCRFIKENPFESILFYPL